MKVTVFTSCYNQGKFLPFAVESVLNQTHKDIEYLLMDDGSTDNTEKVVGEYAKKDPRIVPIYLSKYPNIATVLNLSISMMKSDYWVWVPSDDTIAPNLIEEKLKKITDNNVVLAWGDIMDEAGDVKGHITFNWSTSDEFIKRIWEDCFIGMTGMMVSKQVFNKVGGFPEHLLFSEDFYWILKSTKFDVEYDYVASPLYNKRIHSERTTNKYYPDIIRNIPIIKEEVKRLYGR